MPCTPTSDSASRTSSSLNGLMMAVTSFMLIPSSDEARPYGRADTCSEIEALREGHGDARVLVDAGARDVIAGLVHGEGEITHVTERLGEAHLVVGVILGGGVREVVATYQQTEREVFLHIEVGGKAQVKIVLVLHAG